MVTYVFNHRNLTSYFKVNESRYGNICKNVFTIEMYGTLDGNRGSSPTLDAPVGDDVKGVGWTNCQ